MKMGEMMNLCDIRIKILKYFAYKVGKQKWYCVKVFFEATNWKFNGNRIV